MKKILIGFLLLSVSLFAGYGPQYAHIDKDSINYSAKGNLETPEHSSVILQNGPFLTIESNQFYKEKPRPKYKLRATDIEEEEDEIFSSKKNLKHTNNFASFLSSQLHESLYYNSKNTIAFCKRLSFVLANKRYVLFQVFRI